MSTSTADGPQPRITAQGHLWRTVGMVMISVVALGSAILEGNRQDPLTIGLELTCGALAYVVVVWRRRSPLLVLLLVAVLAVPSGIAAGPAVLATVSVATRRVPWELAVVGAASFVSSQAYAMLTPAPSEPWWLTLGANVVATVAILAWGMYVGSRRELLWTLRQRAERAEAEQELRVDRARVGERAAIAREMHDVLAHRISQISMHAGALAIREDLDAGALREGSAAIQDRANEALRDLRDVLGVLRDAESGELAGRPQPTYADLHELVDRARADGLRVELHDEVVGAETMPPVVGRTVFRIVQEGITNAAKHAPGATLRIVVAGEEQSGVRVALRNPHPVSAGRARPTAPGSGLGLLGLSERADLRGGRLTHHDAGSEFVLEGWIPWTP